MDANRIIVSNYNIANIDNSIIVGNKLLLAKSDYSKIFEFYSNNFYLFNRHIMMFYKINRKHYFTIRKHCFQYYCNNQNKFEDYSFYYKNNGINIDKSFINTYNQLLSERKNYGSLNGDWENGVQLELFYSSNRKVENEIKTEFFKTISVLTEELNIDKCFCVKSFRSTKNLNPYDLILNDWDSRYSKNIIIFKDEYNQLQRGKDSIFIVDGHHRFDLAVNKKIKIINDVLLLNSGNLLEVQSFGISGNLFNSPTNNLDVAKCYKISPQIFDIDFFNKNISKFNLESFLKNSLIWEKIFKKYINDDFIEQILTQQRAK